MVHGEYQGLVLDSPELRRMFTRDALLASDWYAERLKVRQERDIALWKRHLAAVETFRAESARAHPAQSLDIQPCWQPRASSWRGSRLRRT